MSKQFNVIDGNDVINGINWIDGIDCKTMQQIMHWWKIDR